MKILEALPERGNRRLDIRAGNYMQFRVGIGLIQLCDLRINLIDHGIGFIQSIFPPVQPDERVAFLV